MLSPDGTQVMAVGVLVALAAALVAWIVAVFRSTQYPLSQFPIYMFSLVMTRVLWRAKVRGHLELSPEQGAVIVCNHIGPIDPAFIALACSKPQHWLVAREYFNYPVLGWGLRTLQAIPVNRRGIDTAATKLALRHAQNGDIVGLFPEGRINFTPRLLLPGRPGAAMIALKARVPVIPCFVSGTPNDGTPWGFFFISAKAELTIGKPIDISQYYGREGDRKVLEQLTLRFLDEIARLSGATDFQPELAPRRWKHGDEAA